MSVQETSGDEAEYPVVMHGATMNRNEKQKVARVCTPKGSSGHLEVPNDIFKLWNTKAGKEKLYALWAKSGGVKAGIIRCLVRKKWSPLNPQPWADPSNLSRYRQCFWKGSQFCHRPREARNSKSLVVSIPKKT